MALVTNLNVRMKQGNNPLIKMALYNLDESVFDTTVDGLSGIWMLRKNIDSPVLLTKDLDTGMSFSGPNFCNLQMDVLDTKNISGNFVHELALQDGAGNVYTVVNVNGTSGVFLIDKRIAVVPDA